MAYGDTNFDVYNLGNNEFLHSENIDGATRGWVYGKIIQHVIDFLNHYEKADQEGLKKGWDSDRLDSGIGIDRVFFSKEGEGKDKLLESRNKGIFLEFRAEILATLIKIFRLLIFCYRVTDSTIQNRKMLDTKELFDFKRFTEISMGMYPAAGSFYELIMHTQSFNYFISQSYDYFTNLEDENASTYFIRHLIRANGNPICNHFPTHAYYIDIITIQNSHLIDYRQRQQEEISKILLQAKNINFVDIYVEYVIFRAINHDSPMGEEEVLSERANSHHETDIEKSRSVYDGGYAYNMSVYGGKLKEKITVGLDVERLVDLWGLK